jgi:hypothetical protein
MPPEDLIPALAIALLPACAALHRAEVPCKEDLSVRTVLPIERYKIKLNNTVYRYLELYCYLEL